MENHMDFNISKPGRLMVKMCIPSVITILVMQIYHMADTFFIGKLGSPAMLSGLSLASPIIAILSTVGVLVGGGGSAALAMALGRKDSISSAKIVSFSFWSSLGLGTVVGGILLVTLNKLVPFFGASPEASVYCRQYILILAAGAPAMCFPQAMGSLIRGKGKSYQSLIGNMVGSVLNILLDPLFIFVLKMDVRGAAIATVTSNLAASFFYVIYLNQPSFGISASIKNFTMKRETSLTVLSLGLPMAFTTIITFISSILSNKILASYGDIIISSVSITRKIISFVTMLQMGITAGMQPVLAFLFGSGNYKDLKIFTRRTALATIVAGSLLTATCYVSGPSLIRAFMDNPNVIDNGVRCIRIMLLAGPVAGLQQLATTFFQTTKRPLISLALSLTRDGLIYLPVLFLFNSIWGFSGYLVARPVATSTSALLGLVLIFTLFPKGHGDLKDKKLI